MSKFWVIFKREYTQVVKKKSFLVGIFLTPILMAAFMVLPALLAHTEKSTSEHMVVVDQSGSGIGRQFEVAMQTYKVGKDSLPAYVFDQVYEVPVEDEDRMTELVDSLSTAIQNKHTKYLLIVKPHPELADSNLALVTNSDDFQAIRRFESGLTDIISSMRLERSDVNLPVDSVLTLTRRVDLPLRDTQGEAIPFEIKYFAALVLVMLIYAMILSYGTMLMRSVIEEKSSRVMEVLVSSVSPFQLMLGKVMGLGGAAFTTVLVWVLLGAGFMLFGGTSSMSMIGDAVGRMIFNPVIVVFFVLFLVSGYLLYSTIFALIGSILNSEKESQNYMFPIVMFLILPVIVGMGVVRDPYVPWAQVMSYIPLFAPTMMVMRIMFIAPTQVEYSLFSGIVAEGTISFLLVVAAIIGMIWLTGRIFRVGILMYGKRPTLPELARWIRHR